MMEKIFNDENEPFWRSAKRLELGVIDEKPFARFIRRGFNRTGRKIEPGALARLLETTGGHPYATQELSYFLWQETPREQIASGSRLEIALERVLASENSHFGLIWDRAPSAQRQLLAALAREPGRPLTNGYRRRHDLPGPSSVQRALEGLERQELVFRRGGESSISEPFLASWLRRLS